MNPNVIRREVVVQAREGLHLRAASAFVHRANDFQSRVRVQKADQTVDGKSIMELVTLAAERGDVLVLEAEGDDAAEAVDALAALMQNELYGSTGESSEGRPAGG